MSAPSRRTFLRNSAGSMGAIALTPGFEWLSPRPLQSAVSVGLIGVGRQGRAILGELKKFDDKLQVAALCDVDESRLKSGARRAQEAQSFANHAELLEQDGIDAVIVATPTYLHRQIAVDALAAGKHVYCEAPLAHSIEDASAIAKAARDSKSLFQTGMQARSNPVYGLARSFVRSGALRDYVSLHAQYGKKHTWRYPASDPAREKAHNWRLDPQTSTGLAGELGTQQFDVYHWYMNRYPVKVRGSGAVRVHKDGREVADTISCELTFADGLTLAYEASLGSSYERTYELMRGSMATFKLAWSHAWMFKEADAPTQGWEVYANRQQFHNDEGITLIADATQLASQGKLKDGVGLPHSSLYYALESFLKSVTQDAPIACSASEGLRGAVVGILANQAIVSGEEVAIDETHFKGE